MDGLRGELGRFLKNTSKDLDAAFPEGETAKIEQFFKGLVREMARKSA
jgi:hypothetical protein